MATRPPLPYLLKPSEALMLGLSGPVRGAIAAGLAMLGGATVLLGVFNITKRPETQTIAGISNTVLIAAAAAVVLIVYLRPKSKR